MERSPKIASISNACIIRSSEIQTIVLGNRMTSLGLSDGGFSALWWSTGGETRGRKGRGISATVKPFKKG